MPHPSLWSLHPLTSCPFVSEHFFQYAESSCAKAKLLFGRKATAETEGVPLFTAEMSCFPSCLFCHGTALVAVAKDNRRNISKTGCCITKGVVVAAAAAAAAINFRNILPHAIEFFMIQCHKRQRRYCPLFSHSQDRRDIYLGQIREVGPVTSKILYHGKFG